MDVPIRTTRSADGTNIAYISVGGGRPIVVTPSSTIATVSLELDLGAQEIEQLIARGCRMISYDPRGTGLSDRQVRDLSIEALEADLSAVMDAADAREATLIGVYTFAAAAVAYAAHHPDRVTHLLLARAAIRGDAIVPPADSAWRGLVQADWDLAMDALARTYIRASGERAETITRHLRGGSSAEAVRANLAARELDDVSALLPRLEMPTVVLHLTARDQPTLRDSRELADAIPGATLQIRGGGAAVAGEELPGGGGSIQWLAGLALDEFPSTPADSTSRGSGVASGSLRTILFTDVENSTDLVVQHGDAKYRELLAEHERLVREALAAHGGNEIKTIGDSFMCWFSSASSAIDAASAMQRAITSHYGPGLRIRIGIHAAEPIQEADGDLYGTPVVRASRIMGQADGGQILVSQVVTDLVEGKGYLFHDAGEFALKGYERAVHLFDVAWEGE